ncbi:MAG: HD domain-containing protein [Phycisphaerales bacterium]|nr:HD domain-containing protein [Phycisphaerales bacterium]
MNQGTLIPALEAARRTVRQRCRDMGLPTVVVDGSGVLVEGPLDGGVLGEWVGSVYGRRLLASAAEEWGHEDRAAMRALAAGLWALPVEQMSRRRRTGYVVGLGVSRQWLETEEFLAGCQSASLDAGAARAALLQGASFDERSARAAWMAMRWMLDDLSQIGGVSAEVDGFSRQLADSFEEISLLYKLGASMNEINQPERFLKLVCDELHATLGYGWVAALLVRGATRSMTGARRVISAGAGPGDGARIERFVRDALGRSEPTSPAVTTVEQDGEARAALLHPIARDGRLMGVIVAGEKRGADRQVSSMDIKLVGAAASFTGILLDNAALYDDQQAMFLGTLKALTAAIDAKDRYTRGHSERVAHLTRMLAEAVGMTPKEVERTHIAGLVHDVGKIGVPEDVLRKAGKLTDEEFSLIKLHPEIGYNILKDIPQLADVLPGVLHHHERWDGKGYPRRLEGEQIPFVARLIALADSFDAMSSTRTYRPAMPRPAVLAEIARCGGAQFDPEIAHAFLTLDLSVYDQMVSKHLAAERAAMGGQAA